MIFKDWCVACLAYTLHLGTTKPGQAIVTIGTCQCGTRHATT